jgi:hypothetical protein
MAGLLVPILVVFKLSFKNLGVTHEPTVGANQVGVERCGWGDKRAEGVGGGCVRAWVN